MKWNVFIPLFKALEKKVSEKKKLSEKIKEKENQLKIQQELKKKELEDVSSHPPFSRPW